MENLMLDATTLTKEIKIQGSGDGTSVFSGSAYIEKVEVNNLRKPYTKTEVENILRDKLNGKDAEDIQSDLIASFSADIETRIIDKRASNVENRKEVIAKIRDSKKYDKAEDKDAYYTSRFEEINEDFDSRLSREVYALESRQSSLNRLFNFFRIGQSVIYPVPIMGDAFSESKAIFAGFATKEGANNEYIPSAITATFLLADGNKQLDLPLSGDNYKQIMAVRGQSYGMGTTDHLDMWNSLIAEKTIDRVIKYIITGNTLLALGDRDTQGKLISYTTDTGQIKKGLMMPFGYDPYSTSSKDKKSTLVRVPMKYAGPILKGLTRREILSTDGDMLLANREGVFFIQVEASKTKGGKYYLNPELIAMMGQFNKAGNKFQAQTSDINLVQTLVEYLSSKYQLKALLTPEQFERIKDNLPQIDESADEKESQRVEEYRKYVESKGVTPPIDVSDVVIQTTDAGEIPESIQPKEKKTRAKSATPRKPRAKVEKPMTAQKMDTYPLFSQLAVQSQKQAIISSNTTEYNGIIARLEDELANIPRRQSENSIKEYMVYGHYFVGSTDYYITELNADQGIMGGYAILNGDTQMSEFGESSIQEYTDIRTMNLDFHWSAKILNDVFRDSHPELVDYSIPEGGAEEDEEEEGPDEALALKIKIVKVKAMAQKAMRDRAKAKQ
jgi:hypothetical protein